MTQTQPTRPLFLILAAISAVLYLHTWNTNLIAAGVYAVTLAFGFPKRMMLRELFPLVMLFIFLGVLTESPVRNFTISLVYTARALIVFRALILTLARIQVAKTREPGQKIYWVLGLAIELGLMTYLVYSTFKPVTESTRIWVQMLSGGWFVVIGLVLTLLSGLQKSQKDDGVVA